MIGKTVAELMEGIVPSAYAVNVVSLLDDKSDACYPLSIIERVFEPVLAELNEHIAALNALLVQKDIENANLSRAVAELTETKADFYRSGVADGRAQKDAERTSFSIGHETDPNIRTFLHTSDGVFHIDADGKRERLTEAKKKKKSGHRRILYNRPQEVVETREALRLAHDHMRLFLNNYRAGQNVFDTIHAILKPRGKESGK